MEDQKETLQAEATALGIEVDGRWGEARLQQEIDRAKANQVAKEEEQDAYGNGTDDDGEYSGEGEGGTDAGGEPAGDLPREAGADAEGSASGGDEGGALDNGEENSVGGQAEEGEGAPARGSDHLAEDRDGPSQDHDGEGREEPAEMAGSAGGEPVDDAPHHSGDALAPSAGEAGDDLGGTSSEGSAVGSGTEGAASQDHGDGSADGAETPDAAALNGESDALGGLPTIPTPLDEDAKREAIEAARTAMTAPIIAAFNAASAMAGDNSFDASWFAREGDVGDYLPALVGVAVPFVREWPTAPVEALYSHVARSVPVLGHEDAWDDLHFSHRLAWEVFRDVLVKADAAIGAETRRREAAEASDQWGQRDPREDDTMYAPSTSREMRSDLGQARDRA